MMRKYRLVIISLLVYVMCLILVLYGRFHYLQFYHSLRFKDILPFMLILFILFFIGALIALIPFRKLSYLYKLLKTFPVLLLIFSITGSCFAVYNILNWEYGFSDRYNQWTAKEDIKNGTVQIIEVSGLIIRYDKDQPDYFTKESIAEKYGFKYINLGCIYPGNGFYHYNDVMYKYLEKMNGKGWQRKFEDELKAAEKE